MVHFGPLWFICYCRLQEYVGVASSTIMVMNNRVEAEDVSPGSEFLQAVTTEVRESDVKKMFTDVVSITEDKVLFRYTLFFHFYTKT